VEIDRSAAIDQPETPSIGTPVDTVNVIASDLIRITLKLLSWLFSSLQSDQPASWWAIWEAEQMFFVALCDKQFHIVRICLKFKKRWHLLTSKSLEWAKPYRS
jgi:hypothetical protein